jgi:hypothetical protein
VLCEWSKIVAPRAYWKGYLRLSLVSCPITLFPATSEREKVSFHQINKKTGGRIKYRKVDADTGDEVDSTDIIKGYEVGKGQYIEINPEELEAIAIESKRTIEIDEFVPKEQMAARISSSALPVRMLAAANPFRSGTVSRSQTMTVLMAQIEQVGRSKAIPLARQSSTETGLIGLTARLRPARDSRQEKNMPLVAFPG